MNRRLHHRSRVLRAVVLMTILCAGLATVPFASAADPFYEEQLRRGRRAHEIGQFDVAAKRLRIAAFGLLDEPDALVESLVYLALAQVKTGDRGDFDATFERIVEIEDRFGSYGNLDLPQIKAAFEADLVRWISPERLRKTRGFEALGQQEMEASVELRPSAKRKALQRQAAESPRDTTTLLELAELEIQQGRQRKALAALDRIGEIDPTLAEAHCLRVAVGEAMNRCVAVVSSYQPCGVPSFGAGTDLFILTCLVEDEAWDASQTFLAGLPESQITAPPFAAFGARIEKNLLPPEGALALPGAELAEDATEASEEPLHQRPVGLSTEDLATAEKVRELLDAARQPSDLDEPIRLAEDLANRNPRLREAQFLAAETAYRGGRWSRAVEMFRRGGEPSSAEPLLVFYYAVSLFESGEAEPSAKALRSVLPLLRRTPFVDSYASRILDN